MRQQVLPDQRQPRQTPKCSPWSATACPSQDSCEASCPGRPWRGATCSAARSPSSAAMLTSKAEADGRYLSSTGYTGTLDGRYLVTQREPRRRRGVQPDPGRQRRAAAAPRHPSSCAAGLQQHPFGNGDGAHLTPWTKAEADGLSTLEASGGVPDPVVVGAVHGSGTALDPAGGQHQRSSGGPKRHHAGQLRPRRKLSGRRRRGSEWTRRSSSMTSPAPPRA